MAWLVLGWLLLTSVGAVLEIVYGQRFVAAHADAYRRGAWYAAAPLAALFGLAMGLALRRSRAYAAEMRSRFPTRWVRYAFALPLCVALAVGGTVVAPMGWIALAGRILGRPASGVEGRMVSVGEARGTGRGCRHSGRIAVSGQEARLCIQGLVAGDAPRDGDALRIDGRESALGLFIERIERVPR